MASTTKGRSVGRALKSTAKKAVRGLKSAGKEVARKVGESMAEWNTPGSKRRKKSSKSRTSRTKPGSSRKR